MGGRLRHVGPRVGHRRELVADQLAADPTLGSTLGLTEYDEPLRKELGDMVTEHATEQGWSFVGPVAVRFEAVDDLATGVFRVRSTVLAFAGAFIVWCAAALVMAGFAMARRDWARRGLMIIAGFSAVGCLAFILDTPLVVFPAMAAVATVVCLRRVEVRRWFALESR